MSTLGLTRRYRGVVASVPRGKDFGFISINSLVCDNGESPELSTTENVYVHQDDCAAPLRVGISLTFEVVDDPKRSGCLRAQAAVEFADSEVIDVSGIPGFGLVPSSGGAMVVREDQRYKWAARAKHIDPQEVAIAASNQPLPTVPRVELDISDADMRRVVRMFMATLYPQLASFSTDFEVIDVDDAEFDRQVDEAAQDLRELGMPDSAEKMRTEVESFKGIRHIMKTMYEDGLVRPDTVIPMAYLPDLFMACPVWYQYRSMDTHEQLTRGMSVGDPHVDPSTLWFCDRFPNDRWADAFQMFNRRVRGQHMFRGDTIPPGLLKRIKTAITVFDYVVIATPYHDVAGLEWKDPAWARQIDPYVLGFKDGLPVFFIIGRFSDSGVFPLFNDMVADTMSFIREHSHALLALNDHNPYWYQPSLYELKCAQFRASAPQEWHGDQRPARGEIYSGQTGSRLVERARHMQTAFEAGHLFDWLRGEWDIPDQIES